MGNRLEDDRAAVGAEITLARPGEPEGHLADVREMPRLEPGNFFGRKGRSRIRPGRQGAVRSGPPPVSSVETNASSGSSGQLARAESRSSIESGTTGSTSIPVVINTEHVPSIRRDEMVRQWSGIESSRAHREDLYEDRRRRDDRAPGQPAACPRTTVRIEAYGTIDELNAVLGLARASGSGCRRRPAGRPAPG